jgi:hypothetical protein
MKNGNGIGANGVGAVPADIDQQLGLPVVRERYPSGEDGIQKSIKTICTKIREGMATAVMKSYAGNVFRQSGTLQKSTRERALALYHHVDGKVGFAPDALGSEQIQSAAITLCVEGAPICIPIEDCDGLVTCLGTLCAAAGMDVEVVRQVFGAGHQQHVLIEVKLDDGKWFPLDLTPVHPGAEKMPPGTKARAARETRHSPLDAKLTGVGDTAQFVGMGALPVWVWRNEQWVRAPEGVGLGHGKDGSCCEACARGEPCDGESKKVGAGAIWSGLAQLQPQVDWLGKIWSAIDAKGRGWDVALSDAYKRAETRGWKANDPVSRSDLIALIVQSAVSSRAVSSMADPGPRASDALTRTWVVIGKKLGLSSETTIPDIRAAARRRNDLAAITLIEAIIVIVVIAAAAVVYCFAIYYAAKIIDALITRIAAFAELIYLHYQVQRIVDRHLADPNLPWTDEELKWLHQLEKQQASAAEAVTRPSEINAPPPDEGTPLWRSPLALLGIVTVVGGVTLAVVYRKEIQAALAKRSSGSTPLLGT